MYTINIKLLGIGGYCRLVQCFVSFKWAEVSFQPNQTLRLGVVVVVVVVLVVLVVLVVVGLHLKTRAYM